MLQPWIHDAGSFVPSEESRAFICQNTPIKRYLNVGDHETQLFLVAPKGLGKTMLLKYKSYLYREKLKNSLKYNVDSDELIESFMINYPSFSKKDLLQFKNQETWAQLWKFCLLICIIKTYGHEIDPQLDNLVKKGRRVSDLMSEVLTNRKKYKEYTGYIPELQIQLGEVKSGVALFIDNVDQQFGKFLKGDNSGQLDNVDAENLGVKIWINAQLGLLEAIYDINCYKRHVKVFATIRSEAFANLQSALKANYTNYATMLEYTKDEIREIFENNIRMMDVNQYADKRANSLIGKFLGFEIIKHPFVKDEYGESRRETFFDYLYRHSYRKPRDLIRFGRFLYDKVISSPMYNEKNELEKTKEIRDTVYEQCDELFQEYLEEIIPSFNIEELEDFVGKTPTNVIPKKNIEHHNTETVKFYYNLGLIGYTEPQAEDHRLVQKFLPTSTYNYRQIRELPTADFYILHPSMQGTLGRKYTRAKALDQNNIIGYDLHFFDDDMIEICTNIECYFPKKLQKEKRWKECGEKHKLGLFNYYQFFFTDLEEKVVKMRTELRFEFVSKFNQVVQLWAYQKARISRNNYIIETQNIVDILHNDRISLIRKYATELSEINYETCEIFYDRLFGRLLALGGIIFLDLSYNALHSLLASGTMDIKAGKNNNNDTGYNFLRNILYFYNLPKKAEHTPIQEIKNIMLDQASEYERKLLKRWQINFPSYIIKINTLDKEDSNWLNKHISSSLKF